ncbi:MAG: UPF0179 family protein [Candidatus Bathyarchaeota archaeon]
MTNENKPIITLVGLRQAKRGFSFLSDGPLKECEECTLFKVCGAKLETGRVYVVTEVKEKEFSCKIHEGVKVVEVLEPNIETCIERRLSFLGGIITFHSQTCKKTSCPNYQKCVPRGLKDGDKCKVLETKGQVAVLCPLNQQLVLSTLQRVVG